MNCRECLRACARDNPILARVLGVCPLLALSDTLLRALTAAAIMGLLLILTGMLARLLRPWLLGRLRPLAHALLASVLVSALHQLVQGWQPALVAGMELYLPLMALNCLVLDRAESGGLLPAGTAVYGAARTALGIAGAAALLGALRELLAAGTVLGLQPWGTVGEGAAPAGLALAAEPAGALLMLGLLAAGAAALGRDRPVPGAGRRERA